jgi:putative tryptophan/tyrosine transport system substrate-binding protein
MLLLSPKGRKTMRRREFIALIGSVAAAKPLAAGAQQLDRVRRIRLLMGLAESDPEAQSSVGAFREELRKLGWTEGRNVEIDIRWATGDVESMERFAKEFVALQPDLIVTVTTPATAAILKQTSAIPIIFVLVADPIGSGFVTNLSRPGGNVTGFTNQAIVGSLGSKWVELLKEVAPRVIRVTFLFNPPTATSFVEGYLNHYKAAAAARGMEALVAPVHDMPEVEHLLATQARESNSGLVVLPDAFTWSHSAEITSLAARFRVPAVYWSRSSAELGGLISYGPPFVDEFRHAASYVDRILKGVKPNELPIQAPTKFCLVINLKTAKALGLDVPLSLLATADEVIE